MEGLELISFQIISAVGTARSLYIEAIQEAKRGNFTNAQRLLDDGVEMFREGHKAHMELLTKEASGNSIEFALILMHAEDQLMSAEGFKMIAEEFIDVYKKIGE